MLHEEQFACLTTGENCCYLHCLTSDRIKGLQVSRGQEWGDKLVGSLQYIIIIIQEVQERVVHCWFVIRQRFIILTHNKGL